MLGTRKALLALSRANLSNVTLNQGVRILGFGPTQIQVATLIPTHGEKFPYHPKPFPYQTKKYNIYHELWDANWLERKTENSKVIVIDGNVGVGKHKFAQQIAAEFDLKVFHTPEKAGFMCNAYDVRRLDHLLPEAAKTYGLKQLFFDPKPESGRIAGFLFQWYMRKCYDYARALSHVLHTGQGVVFVKSPFTEPIFIEVFMRMGWITKNFYEHMHEIMPATLSQLLPPHLTLYLDAPISTLRERIAARNDPKEMNAPNFNDDYLQMVDDVYKDMGLPRMSDTGEVLQIDWTEFGDDLDLDVIATDISHLKLETSDNEDTKFQNWFQLDLSQNDTVGKRILYQIPDFYNEMLGFSISALKCPELWISDADAYNKWCRIVDEHPALCMDRDWAPELGDATKMRFF